MGLKPIKFSVTYGTTSQLLFFLSFPQGICFWFLGRTKRTADSLRE
jgi:hypothetical protein